MSSDEDYQTKAIAIPLLFTLAVFLTCGIACRSAYVAYKQVTALQQGGAQQVQKTDAATAASTLSTITTLGASAANMVTDFRITTLVVCGSLVAFFSIFLLPSAAYPYALVSCAIFYARCALASARSTSSRNASDDHSHWLHTRAFIISLLWFLTLIGIPDGFLSGGILSAISEGCDGFFGPKNQDALCGPKLITWQLLCGICIIILNLIKLIMLASLVMGDDSLKKHELLLLSGVGGNLGAGMQALDQAQDSGVVQQAQHVQLALNAYVKVGGQLSDLELLRRGQQPDVLNEQRIAAAMAEFQKNGGDVNILLGAVSNNTNISTSNSNNNVSSRPPPPARVAPTADAYGAYIPAHDSSAPAAVMAPLPDLGSAPAYDPAAAASAYINPTATTTSANISGYGHLSQ